MWWLQPRRVRPPRVPLRSWVKWWLQRWWLQPKPVQWWSVPLWPGPWRQVWVQVRPPRERRGWVQRWLG